VRFTFARSAVAPPAGTGHYTRDVAIEVIEFSRPRRPIERPMILMWKAPSHIAATEHAKRPAGRSGPIEIVVLAHHLGEDRWRVFHMFRPRRRDLAAWEASQPYRGR